MKTSFIVALTALASCNLMQAELLHHWTFETDGSNSGTSDIAMILQANASLSTSCSILGDGSLYVTSVGAPATGGAITESAITWSSFANGDTRTLSFWAKPAIPQEANATMFGTGVNATSQRFDIKNPGNFRVEIQGTGQNTGFSLLDDRWHHIVVVAPNAVSTMSDLIFYVDGAEVTNGSTSPLAIDTADAILRLGDSANTATDRDFEGHIDDVRIYDTALTPAEIVTLAGEGRLIGCFAVSDDSIVLGTGTDVDLSWDATGFSSLTITDDQGGAPIDAAALSTNGVGMTTVSPTVTTVYTLTGVPSAGGASDVRTVTVSVKTTPDVLTFTAAPDFIYGIGDSTLSWTTEFAGRVVINDGVSDIATFTTTADTQTVVDAGTFVASGITATTTYTLTATIAEDGSGDEETLTATVTVQPGPDLTFLATPSVTDGTANVTLLFSATVIENVDETTIGFVDDFADDGNVTNGFDLGDSLQDFDALLGVVTPGVYLFEPTNGSIAGNRYPILTWSGDTVTVDTDIAADTSWLGDYRIVEVSFSGADTLTISDGASTIFTTSDPAVIAKGSFDAGVISADTTFTATASITGGGSTMETATVTTTGAGSTYEEVILADAPVGYFRFEEQENSAVIFDSSGNGNHSTSIGGAQFLASGQPGIIGKGGNFTQVENVGASVVTGVILDPQDPDGDDNEDDIDPDGGEGWTVEALAMTNVPELAENRHILSNQNGTGFGRSVLYLNFERGEYKSFVGNSTSPNANATLNVQKPFIVNAWCHIAMTCTENQDGIAGDPDALPEPIPATPPSYTLRFYVDGQLVTEQVVGSPAVPRQPEAADGAWVIGSHKARQAGGFWQGILDEVAIYDKALTSSQIATHNNAFLANSTGLLAFGRDQTIVRGQSAELFAKVGAGSTSATIDNGIGPVAPGSSLAPSVTPTETTIYTIDVDGVMQSVTVTVVDPLEVVDCGLADESGNPFVTVKNLVEGESYRLFGSPNLQIWTALAPPVVADASGEATFSALAPIDTVVQPTLFYQVQQQ